MRVSTRADDADKHGFDVNDLLYHKGRLYSAGDDGKVKLWEADLKFITEVQAHPCSVFCLAASEDTLYSCSNEGTVKAWDLKTLKPKGTLVEDKSSEFWKIYYSDGCLYCGDNDGNITIYKDNKRYGQLNICEPVKDMLVWKSCIYTVKDVDLAITEAKLGGEHLQYATLKTLRGKSPVTIIGDKFLIFASRSGKDIIIHENSHENHYKSITEVKGAHEMIINAMKGVDWDSKPILFSGGWDKLVKKWKIDGDQVKEEASCNADIVVNTMAVGEKGFIYVGGGDGHIIRIDS